MLKIYISTAVVLSSIMVHSENVLCMDEMNKMTTKANRIFDKAMELPRQNHEHINKTLGRLFAVRKNNTVLLNLLDKDKQVAVINKIGMANYNMFHYQAAADYWERLFTKDDNADENATEDDPENTLFDRVGNYEKNLDNDFDGDLEQGLLLGRLGASFCKLGRYNDAIHYLDMLFLEKELEYRHFDCVYYDIEDNEISFVTSAYFIAKAYFEIGNYHMARLHLDGNRKRIYKIYRGHYIKDDLKRMNKIMSAARRGEQQDAEENAEGD
ncbi:hypothetical protein FACS189472_02090 [Alphaproteobacteria bacterium]|nr:hypothetical protein FACS189472_02090 [Alphaproteobacteria bacterium]